MIDPTNGNHRDRLQRSISYWSKQHETYHRARQNLIVNYIGCRELAVGYTGDRENTREQYGTLIQQAAKAHVISLAYGEPKFTVVGKKPSVQSLAFRGQEALNWYSQRVGLRKFARRIALDSYFGWAIGRVNVGSLPGRLKEALGTAKGPLLTRVSPFNFFFDGSAADIDEAGYAGDFLYVPLDYVHDNRDNLGWDQDVIDGLEEYRGARSSSDYRLQSATLSDSSPQPMTRLAYVWLPDARREVLWPANTDDAGEISGPPLTIREWKGYFEGPYSYLSMLDSLDEIIPISEALGTLPLHTLYNQLYWKVANQSLEARYNPVYETGGDLDAKAIDDSEDRSWVGVSNINRLAKFEIPGAGQAEMNVLGVTIGSFKEAAGNLDDTLGIGQTAKTATQSQLIRQRTSAVTFEKIRRMNEFMEGIGRGLFHFLLDGSELTIPVRAVIEGTDIDVDASLSPDVPREAELDDYDVEIVPWSMPFRSPEEKVEALNQAVKRMAQMAQIRTLGIPVELDKYAKIEADYNQLPELKDIMPQMYPEQILAGNRQGGSQRRPGTGEYVRHNVSEGTSGGALAEAFNNAPAAGGEESGAGLVSGV